MPPISKTIQKTERESNMELLRIISMFLVLVVHASFFSIPAPTDKEIITSPYFSYFRYFVQAVSIICVNVFILISGWFSIRPKYKSISNFIFQCAFYIWGIYFIFILIKISTLSISGLAYCFLLKDLNWFIKSYLALYILSPILNSFIDNSTKKQFQQVLLFFFLFQTVFGWFSQYATGFINNGYSVFSFIGLYLIGRYIRLYPNIFTKFNKTTDLLICLALILLNASLSFGVAYLKPDISESINMRIFSYISPLVIVCSIYFFLFFTKIKIQSRFINWVSASSFAVFLTHTHFEIVFRYFKTTIIYIYNSFSPTVFITISLLFLIGVFIFSILIDKIRIIVYKPIEKALFISNS